MFTIAFKYSLVLPAICLQKGNIIHSSATLIVTTLLQSFTEYTLRSGKRLVGDVFYLWVKYACTRCRYGDSIYVTFTS